MVPFSGQQRLESECGSLTNGCRVSIFLGQDIQGSAATR
jgi:hypothetical protein